MPSSFRWQLSASRLCISFHTWHLSACMWPCIYAFFQTCCGRVSTWLNLGGFTRISCDIMPSALRWQLSAIRWHCTSFLSYLVLFGKHLTMLGGILTAGSNLAGEERSWGRDESVRRGAGSQWIVAARPLCHLQCPVAYLSRLQRFSPPPVWKGASRRPATAHRPDRLSQWHGPLGAQAPLTWVGASGRRRRRLLAWILT